MVEKDIFKNIKRLKYLEKRDKKMGIGEYVGFLTFGILSTGAIAYNPGDLSLFILGAVLISILIYKFANFAYGHINKFKLGFLVTSLIGGILSSVGLVILLKNQNFWLMINGFTWIMMGVVLVKFNLDDVI